MKMKSVLQPGIKAPEFTLSAVNLEHEVSVGGQSAHVTAILFFGSEVKNEIAGLLASF